jgi:hypothetical protein
MVKFEFSIEKFFNAHLFTEISLEAAINTELTAKFTQTCKGGSG